MKKVTVVLIAILLISSCLVVLSGCNKMPEYFEELCNYFEYDSTVYYKGKALVELDEYEHFEEMGGVGFVVTITDQNKVDYSEVTCYISDKAYNVDGSGYDDIVPEFVVNNKLIFTADEALYCLDIKKNDIQMIYDEIPDQLMKSPDGKSLAFLVDNELYTCNGKFLQKNAKQHKDVELTQLVAVSNKAKQVYYLNEDYEFCVTNGDEETKIADIINVYDDYGFGYVTFNRDNTELLCLDVKEKLIYYKGGKKVVLDKNVEDFYSLMENGLGMGSSLDVWVYSETVDVKSLLDFPVYCEYDDGGEDVVIFNSKGEKRVIVSDVDYAVYGCDGVLYEKNGSCYYIGTKENDQRIKLADEEEYEYASQSIDGKQIGYIWSSEFWVFDGKEKTQLANGVDQFYIKPDGGFIYLREVGEKQVNEWYASSIYEITHCVKGEFYKLAENCEVLEVCYDGMYFVEDDEVYYLKNGAKEVALCE